jgi:nucleoside-diphosphate-sugar epimerase
MNILVIGGTRFIGAHTVSQLHQQNHKVTVFHRGKTQSEFLPEGIDHIHGNRKELLAYRSQFQSLEPDVVIDTCAFNEQDATTFTGALADIAPRVVLLSSGDVYRAYGIMRGTESGSLQEVPIPEDGDLRTEWYPYRGDEMRADDDPKRHQDFYDKIPVERMFADAFETTVLRLPAVYGPGDHRPWGYLKKMLDNRPAILLGEASSQWRFIRGYVDDVADAIVRATTNQTAAGRVYNVGESDPVLEQEWVGAIAKAVGWTGEIRVLPEIDMPKHIQMANPKQHLTYDTTRIRKDLGWESPTDFETGLTRTIDWELEHLPENYDTSVFDYDAEDRALAGLD